MLNIPGLEVEVPAKKSSSKEFRYISQPDVEKELGWTKQDADELFEYAKTMPRVREQSTYGRKKMFTCAAASHRRGRRIAEVLRAMKLIRSVQSVAVLKLSP